MSSSDPPGHVRVAIPNGVIWSAIGFCIVQAIAGIITCVKLWHDSDKEMTRLQDAVGEYKAAADRAHELAASCESKLDSHTHRLEVLEMWLPHPKSDR